MNIITDLLFAALLIAAMTLTGCSDSDPDACGHGASLVCQEQGPDACDRELTVCKSDVETLTRQVEECLE